MFWTSQTPTPWVRRSVQPNPAFLGKLFKTKVVECPQFSEGRSGLTRSRNLPGCLAVNPSARGRYAAMVPGLIGLKLG